MEANGREETSDETLHKDVSSIAQPSSSCLISFRVVVVVVANDLINFRGSLTWIIDSKQLHLRKRTNCIPAVVAGHDKAAFELIPRLFSTFSTPLVARFFATR